MADDQDDESYMGIRVVNLAVAETGAVVLVLAEPLGCPHCGLTGTQWVAPARDDELPGQDDEPPARWHEPGE